MVQESGYYPAIGMNDKFAAIEYTNLHYYVREYNKVFVENEMIACPDQLTDVLRQALEMKGFFRTFLKYRAKMILRRHASEETYKKLKGKWQKLRGQTPAENGVKVKG